MHAITIPEPGGPEALVWAEVPDPVPGEGEVLVEVVASAVNRADLLQRQGFYDPPPGSSPYPGLECSGRISELGPGVSGWAVGDEVCALLAGGGYAEKVAVPAGQLLPVPEGLDLVTAAALPEVTATVWSNVFMIAHLRPGETLLIHGGASGIGTMAIQLAKAVGARVAVTAGGPEKLARCAELGADILIDYREQDFVEELRKATDGAGADVILDIVGAKYLDRNVKALAVNGRLAVIGLQGGVKGELNLAMLLGKRAAIAATSLRGRPLGEKASIMAAVREHVWPLIEGAWSIRWWTAWFRCRTRRRRIGCWSRARTSARCCWWRRRRADPTRPWVCGGTEAPPTPLSVMQQQPQTPSGWATLQIRPRADCAVGALFVGLVGGAGREGAAHLLELGAGRHLLREQRRLDSVEETLQPAHQLGLRNAQLRLGGDRLVGEGEAEALEFLNKLRGQAVLQLLHRAGVDLLEPDPARLVQRCCPDFLQQLLDHASDAHDLRRLFDHLCHRDLARLVVTVTAAECHPVLSHNEDVGALLRPFIPRHLHAAILSHWCLTTRCAPVRG